MRIDKSIFLNKRMLVLICWVLALKLPMWFARMTADGGVAAINGIGLLHGEVPYQDWWEFKVPGVFILNALGAFLFGESALGIRIFELIWIFFSVFVFDRIITQVFSVKRFSLPTFIFAQFICSWALLRYGNTITLWAALPWLLAVFFWLKAASPQAIALRDRYISAFLFGLCMALAFVIRQSALAIAPIMILALLFSQRLRKRIGVSGIAFCLLLSLLGAAVVIGALAFWLHSMGVLGEAITWFKVTSTYVRSGWMPGFRAREGGYILRNTTLAIFPLLFFVLASLYRQQKFVFQGPLTRRLIAIIIGVKCAIVLCGGRFYNHYFMEFAPELVLLAAPVFLNLEDSFSRMRLKGIKFSQWLGVIGAGTLLVLQVAGSGIYIKRFFTYNTKVEHDVTDYIRKFTSKNRTYFSWEGQDTAMFYLTDHRQISPLRFNWFLLDISEADPLFARRLDLIMAKRIIFHKPPIVLLTTGGSALSEIKAYAPDLAYAIQTFYFPDKHFGRYWVWRLR